MKNENEINELEFENERDKELNDLIDKVTNMEIPEMFGDGKLTEDEKRIRAEKKVVEYIVEKTYVYHNKDGSKRKKFVRKRKNIKVCENGIIIKEKP